jgi:hypothetical protein
VSKDAGRSWSFNYTGHSLNTMYRTVLDEKSHILYAATSSVHDMYMSTHLTDKVSTITLEWSLASLCHDQALLSTGHRHR